MIIITIIIITLFITIVDKPQQSTCINDDVLVVQNANLFLRVEKGFWQ